MALGLEKSNIGYDVNGMQQLINKINLEAIPNACSTIVAQKQNVLSAIDTVWQGASASAFKTKLTNDTEELTKALREIGAGISEQMHTVGRNVEEYDAAVAEMFGSSSSGGGGGSSYTPPAQNAVTESTTPSDDVPVYDVTPPPAPELPPNMPQVGDIVIIEDEPVPVGAAPGVVDGAVQGGVQALVGDIDESAPTTPPSTEPVVEEHSGGTSSAAGETTEELPTLDGSAGDENESASTPKEETVEVVDDDDRGRLAPPPDNIEVLEDLHDDAPAPAVEPPVPEAVPEVASEPVVESPGYDSAPPVEQTQVKNFSTETVVSERASSDQATADALGITLEQLDVVKATIRHEAGNNPYEMMNVTSCMKNRMDAGNWGGTDPYSVATAPGQFSSYLGGSYQQFTGGNYYQGDDVTAKSINEQINAILLGEQSTTHDYDKFKSKSAEGGDQLTENGNRYGI